MQNYATWIQTVFNRPLTTGKNKKPDWINERGIRRKDYDRICST